MDPHIGLNVVIVGDEYVASKIRLLSNSTLKKIKSVDYFGEKFADINSTIKLANRALENKLDVDLMILFPFLWEIIYMDIDTKYNISTLRMKDDCISLNDLTSLIESSLKRWKTSHPNLIIYWCLPFTPNFYHYNIDSNSKKERHKNRMFYKMVRTLWNELPLRIPDIHLFDLHKCYFLYHPSYEKDFHPGSKGKLYHVRNCTIDGLIPSKTFTSNFLFLFESEIYPHVLKLKQKDSLENEPVSDYLKSPNHDSRKTNLFPMRVFDYSSTTSGIDTNQEFGNEDKCYSNNNVEEIHENPLRNSEEHSAIDINECKSSQVCIPSQLNNTNYYKSSQMQLPTKTVDSNYYKDFQLQHCSKSNDPGYYNDLYSQFPPEFNDSINLQDIQKQYFDMENVSEELSAHSQCENNSKSQQDTSNISLPTNTTQDQFSRKSISEIFSSFRYKDSNISKDSFNSQSNQNISPSNIDKDISLENQSNSFLSEPYFNSSGEEKMKEQNNFLFSDISAISPNILNSVKKSLIFLNSNKNVSSTTTSPYYENYIQNFFYPHWKHLFLRGNENVALDCLGKCVNSLKRLFSKKGIVIAVTSSQDFINYAKDLFKDLVKSNTIGFNDDIKFGLPLVLVDTASNMQLRLSQVKFKNLADVVAIIAFGDDLLDLYSLMYVEFCSVVKKINCFTTGDSINKVIISESGTVEKEISAQSIFNTTFVAPRRGIEKEKELEITQESVGLTDFLKSTSIELEVSNDSPSSFQNNSNSTATVKGTSETWKSPTKERSKSPYYKKRSRSPSSSHLRSPKRFGKSSSSSMSSKSTKRTFKLEDIFMRARVPITEEKKREIDGHNKKFMEKLETMSSSIQEGYLQEGKKVLQDHESDFKTYKEVPDLHPLYEEKYEYFIKLFKESYGCDYNPSHLQTTWKRFWDITILSLKELEWIDKRRKLQEDFMSKYQMNENVRKKEKKKPDMEKEDKKPAIKESNNGFSNIYLKNFSETDTKDKSVLGSESCEKGKVLKKKVKGLESKLLHKKDSKIEIGEGTKKEQLTEKSPKNRTFIEVKRSSLSEENHETSQTLKNADSLIKEVDRLLSKGSCVSAGGKDKKKSRDKTELHNSPFYEKDQDKNLPSSSKNIKSYSSSSHLRNKEENSRSIEKSKEKYTDDRRRYNRDNSLSGNDDIKYSNKDIQKDKSFKNDSLHSCGGKTDTKSMLLAKKTSLSQQSWSTISPSQSNPNSQDLSFSAKNKKSTFKEFHSEEDFKNLYINSCSELASTKAKGSQEKEISSSELSLLDDLVSSSLINKPIISQKASEAKKPKIVFNLSKPKIKFSLHEALNALDSISSSIGVMGTALKSIVKSSRNFLPNIKEAYKVFLDSDNELLVQITINKLKSMSSSSPDGEKEKYQKVIELGEKLLEETNKFSEKKTLSSSSTESTFSPRINVEAVANATKGFSKKDTYQFIKNTFMYKGLSEPTTSEVHQIFKEVSELHFKYSIK